MLARVAVFAAVLCALALVVPNIAPRLLAGLASGGAASAGGPAAGAPHAGRDAEEQPAQPVRGQQLALRGDSRGHFVTKAHVNGHTIDVMVDTGATVVSISDDTARRLGIRPPRTAFTARIATANGEVRAAPVRLAEVRLGSLLVRDVEAVVVPGNALPVDLLGMSFIGRLSKFEIAGGRLVLTQ
jgi:aspartyl protease family protein